MDPRDELVERTVDEAKGVARQVGALAETEARLAAREARDALEPALPSIRRGAAAAGLAAAGAVLVLLPFARRLARHAIASSLAGGAALGVAAVLAQRAAREFPPDLRDRVRALLRTDAKVAVDAATAPSAR